MKRKLFLTEVFFIAFLIIFLFSFSSCEELFTETPVDKHDLSFITQEDIDRKSREVKSKKSADTETKNERPLRKSLFESNHYYGNYISTIDTDEINQLKNIYPEIETILQMNDETAYEYMVSNEISPVKNYEIIKYRGDDCFPESSMNLNTILLMENRFDLISKFINQYDNLRDIRCLFSNRNLDYYNSYTKLFPLTDEEINILLINLAFFNDTEIYPLICGRQTLNDEDIKEIISYLVFYRRFNDIENLELSKKNRIYYISVALLYGVSEPFEKEENLQVFRYKSEEYIPILVRTRNYSFLKMMVSLGVRINFAINFTDDLYIKGYMLKGKERSYYHPMIVLLMSEDVKFDESFLWDFVKDALSPEVPPEYLYYYLNTNKKYNEPSKYGSKSAMLADLMKTKPENYLVKAKILIRYGADKTFCDEDGKCFNDYVTNEELEELKKIKTKNFLKRKE